MPLPKSSPQRDSTPPMRLNHPIPSPQRIVKGRSRAGVLRSTPASNVVLRGIGSPDVERDKAAKESQMQAQQRKAKAEKEDKDRRQREAQELASSQARVARAESRYQAKVVQPLKRWLHLLDKFSSELPPSLAAYRHWTTSDARAAWPLHRIQLLNKDLDSLTEELAEVKRDVQVFERRVRALQKAVLTVAKQTMGDLKLTKNQGLHARSNALGNDYLRVVGKVILCLDDLSLLKIQEELIKRKKWVPTDAGLPYPRHLWHQSRTLFLSGLQPRGTGIPFLGNLDNDFFRGSLDPRTLEALFGLYTARTSLGELALATARLLHVWRQHDKNLQLLNEAPYLSSYERAFDRVHTLEDEHSASVYSTALAIQLYGSMLFMRRNHSVGKSLARFARLDQLRRSLLSTEKLIEVLLDSTFCGGASFLLLRPTSVLDRALIAMYRPFYLVLSVFVDIRLTALDWFKQGERLHRPSLAGSVMATTHRISVVAGEVTILVKNAAFWSSAYDLYYGGNFRPHSAVTSQTNTMEELNQHALELPSVAPLVIPDDLSTTTTFYHERTAIPVNYVSDVRDARVVKDLSPEERRVKRNRNSQERKRKKRHIDPDYLRLHIQKKERRREAKRKRARPMTGLDAAPSAVVPASLADGGSRLPEIEAAPRKETAYGGEISSSIPIGEQRSLEGEGGRTPLQERRERGRLRRRGIRHAPLGYGEAQQKRKEERQKRRQADFKRIVARGK